MRGRGVGGSKPAEVRTVHAPPRPPKGCTFAAFHCNGPSREGALGAREQGADSRSPGLWTLHGTLEKGGGGMY